MFKPKIITCLREYSWSLFRADLGAGVVVGLVALPLAMAFAIASGLPPERGLYTAIVAGFLISLLGGSRVQIGGPTGAFVVIVAGIVQVHGYPGLVMATIMAGVILILMGISRLGTMVKFIPYPVTTGFTSGIAIVIFSSQIRDFFGLTLPSVPPDFLSKWPAYMTALPTLNPAAMLIASGTTLLIALWPKRWHKIPSPAAALVLATGLVALLNLPVETIGSRFGGIPSGLPHWSWPVMSWSTIKTLIPSATTIALLAAIESLLSAVVADGMIGGHHKSDIELVAQGIANIASPMFGGIPATGAIARTATNVRNGGRTPIAGITHAVVLLIILLCAGPLAAKIPLASLAGILVVVCYNMSEWRSFQFLLQGPRSDIVILLTTFFLTVLVDLTVAVEVGMVLAAMLFMRHMANLTQVRALSGENAGDTETGVREALHIPANVQVYSACGSFFFGAAHKLMETIRIVSEAPKALVLDMTGVLHIDASGLHVLQQIQKECRQKGTAFYIVGIQTQPRRVFHKTGLFHSFGEAHFLPTLRDALQKIA